MSVAQELGVVEESICHWEANETTPRLRYLPKIIEFLGYVPIECLPAETFGQKIVVARKCKGLTQTAFANHLGIDPTALARWESSKSQPAPKYLQRLDKMFAPSPAAAF